MDTRFLIVHYFLADDTIEVIEKVRKLGNYTNFVQKIRFFICVRWCKIVEDLIWFICVLWGHALAYLIFHYFFADDTIEVIGKVRKLRKYTNFVRETTFFILVRCT